MKNFLLVESTCPVRFPSKPGLVCTRDAIPFLPGIGEGSALDGVLCAGGDHGGLGDVDLAVVGEFLTVLLFANVNDERDGGIYALVEAVEIFIEIRLVDVTISLLDVVEDVLDFDAVESFDGIVEFGVVHVVNRGCG